MSERKAQGDAAEKQACTHLQQAGLRLIEKNFHCRQGEIDLIMQEGEALVFIEVRYRRNNHFGNAAESVNARKQAKLISTAQYYLLKHPKLAHAPCRFDVVSITGHELEWIKNAFQL